jgi:hypothetical protein
MEGGQAAKAPSERDVGDQAITAWDHQGCPAFLKPATQDILREARSARFEQ